MGKFEKADTAYNFPEMEERILHFWEAEDVFGKSLRRPSPKGNFVFYEGPPTANAKPHPGHVLTRVIKDLFPRYKTMRGYYVARKAGWDTHGLPVEIEIEKELGFTGKADIEKFGIAEFNERCLASVQRYEKEWRRISNRIGFWLNYDEAYFTYTNGGCCAKCGISSSSTEGIKSSLIATVAGRRFHRTKWRKTTSTPKTPASSSSSA
jgi:isoleucyl-tRNA synthetase